jgi:hypothetical protein
MIVMIASPNANQRVEQVGRDLHHPARGLEGLLIADEVHGLVIEVDAGLRLERDTRLAGDGRRSRRSRRA